MGWEEDVHNHGASPATSYGAQDSASNLRSGAWKVLGTPLGGMSDGVAGNFSMDFVEPRVAMADAQHRTTSPVSALIQFAGFLARYLVLWV